MKKILLLIAATCLGTALFAKPKNLGFYAETSGGSNGFISAYDETGKRFRLGYDGAISTDNGPDWKLGGYSGGDIEVTINVQKYAITATPIP